MNVRSVACFVAGAALASGFGWFGLPALLYERLEQPLPFDHALHVEGQGMDCESCHGTDEAGRFAGLPDVASCAECHEAPLGDSEGERRLVEDFVEPGREVPWLVYARQPDNVHFPHAVHVQLAELPCERCHGDHGATEALRPYERNRLTGYGRDLWGPSLLRRAGTGMKMTDCAACHRERGVEESCLDCHK